MKTLRFTMFAVIVGLIVCFISYNLVAFATSGKIPVVVKAEEILNADGNESNIATSNISSLSYEEKLAKKGFGDNRTFFERVSRVVISNIKDATLTSDRIQAEVNVLQNKASSQSKSLGDFIDYQDSQFSEKYESKYSYQNADYTNDQVIEGVAKALNGEDITGGATLVFLDSETGASTYNKEVDGSVEKTIAINSDGEVF